MTQCNKPYTVESIHNIEIDDLATLPDYLMGMREVENPATGATIITPVRVPTEKIAPTGLLQNVVALATNNQAITVPEGQVRAGYIEVQPGGNIVRYADATHPAQFLIVSDYTNGKVLIQTTGFLTIPNGHSYICGEEYYVGDGGVPVTDDTSGQKLFKPLSDMLLNINGDF